MRSTRWLAAGALLLAAQVSACGGSSTFSNAPAGNGSAARVEPISGTSAVRVVLSATAVQRLGIQTARVRHQPGGRRTVIPYAAVLYGPDGSTFAFTNPSPRVYVARPITVDRISGQVAVLRSGPPAGTAVVTVGSSELLGAQYGVEEG